MKLTSTLTTFFYAVFGLMTIFSMVSASPLALEKRDVFTPPVLDPHAGTHWYTGEVHNVTWDISDAPVNITNKIGRIQLREGDITTPLILAANFSILLGSIEVTVPWVLPGDDYSVVLFGDSGNFSPEFSIN